MVADLEICGRKEVSEGVGAGGETREMGRSCHNNGVKGGGGGAERVVYAVTVIKNTSTFSSTGAVKLSLPLLSTKLCG